MYKERENLWKRLTPPSNTANRKHKHNCYGSPTFLWSDLLTPCNPFTCARIQPFFFPSILPFATLPTTCTAAKVWSAPHLPDIVSLIAGRLTVHALIPELVMFPLKKANLQPEKKSTFLLLLDCISFSGLYPSRQLRKKGKKVHLVLLKIF